MLQFHLSAGQFSNSLSQSSSFVKPFEELSIHSLSITASLERGFCPGYFRVKAGSQKLEFRWFKAKEEGEQKCIDRAIAMQITSHSPILLWGLENHRNVNRA